jgi:CheY-like chemotaxis protein
MRAISQLGTPTAVANTVAWSAPPAGLDAAAAIALATQAQQDRWDRSWTKQGHPYVLIVMHDTTERLLLKRMCQVEGCVVHTSETGVGALQIIAANEGTYALCLIDTVLPDVEPHLFCSQMSRLVRGGAGCKPKTQMFTYSSSLSTRERETWCGE